MVNSPRPQERENPYVHSSLSPRPNGNTKTNSTSSSTSSNSNVIQPQPPLTPKTITRSEANTPYPTTFIQANSSSFKQVVQMLTGSSETAKQASKPVNSIPPIKNGPKKQGYKLYERRNSIKNLKLSPLMPGYGHRTPEILSPSMLDFPSLILSPVTPLIPDPFNRSPPTTEQRAIAEKGYYLHPSPVTTPGGSEPKLLPLFPLTSPRVSGSSS